MQKFKENGNSAMDRQGLNSITYNTATDLKLLAKIEFNG